MKTGCTGMIITSIHHIHFEFPSHSREDVRFFYGTVLNAHELPVPEKKQFLQFAIGQQLLCFTPETRASCRKPAQHVAFNIQGIALLKQRLKNFDLDFIESHPEKPERHIYIKDPAGNQLAFLENHPH